mmetsp:Transcript_27971/g.46195  ORF Transcript_27971/g.46195 Transcript_27971/m.46195 type:complete len:111 (-) Transcript_27971:94-426(-)
MKSPLRSHTILVWSWESKMPGEYITRVNRTVATPGGQHDLLWRTLLEALQGRRLTLRFARSAGGGAAPPAAAAARGSGGGGGGRPGGGSPGAGGAEQRRRGDGHPDGVNL